MPNTEQQYNPLVQGSFTTYEAPINNFEQPNALSSMELDIKAKIELADASKFSGLKANETKMLQNVFGAEKASWTNYDVTVGEAYRKIGDKYYTKYDDPNLGFVAGMDNEERYGRAQSSASKWGNGLVKLFGKTSTAVLGGTIGTISGAFNAIQQGSMSALYTDSFNQMLDDLNEKMDYKLPNYYTRQEQNKSLLGQMGTANFWANDVLGGLTFTLGMVVSEGIWAYATGGMSLASAPVRWGAKALGLSRAQKALGAYKAIGKKTLNSAVTKQAVDTARTASTRASKAKDLLNQARFLYTSAGYEGGVEARHYMKETEEIWVNNFRQTMGRDPNSKELLEFRRGLTSSANAVFIGNVGLVGATNLAVFGRTLLGAKSTAKFKNNWFKNKVLGVGFEKTDDTVRAIKATRSQKIRSNVYDVLKPVFLEGFVEEGGQSVMSKAAEAYTMSAYDPISTIENIDILDALWEGFKETYGTKEGQKEVLIGAIIGVFGGGISGSFNQSARERKAIEDVSKYYNSFTAKNLLNNNIYASRVKSATLLVDKATSEGDKVGGAIGERMGTVAKIERDYAFGGVKEGAEDYKAYMYSSIEQIKEDLGLDQESAVEWIEEKASEYSKLADEYVKNREFAEAFIGSNDVAEFKNANISTDAVRRALALYLTIGKEADVLASNTIRDIQDIVVNKLGNHEVVRAMGITEGLRRANNNAYRRYNEANKKLKALEEQYNKLRDRLAQIDSTREQNEAEASERAKIVNRFEELNNKIQKEQLNKQAAYSALNLKDVTDQTITMEDLDNQDENLKTLQDAIEGLRKSDPSEYQAINDLLREYKTAITYAKSFKDVAEKMISADTKTTEITGWLTKLFSKNKKLEEGEQAWFANLVMNYQKDKIADVLHSDPTRAEETDPKEKIDTIAPKAEEARDQEIKDLAQKIANGETNFTPAELQLQINNPQELERELSRIRQEREPLEALKKQKAQKQQELENLKNNTSSPIEVVPESDAVEGQYFIRELFGEQEAQPSTTSSSNTVQTPSDIEAQKADIERRKQEELISKVKNILNKLGLEYLLPKSVTNIFNLDKSRTKSKAGMTAQWDSLRDAILLNEDFSLENLIHELIHSYIQREVQEDSYENSKKLSDKARRLAEKIKELNDKGNFNANVNFLISYVLQGQENIPITNYEEFATYYLTNKTVREALEKNGFGNIVKSFVKELTGLSDNQISNIIKLDLTAIESNKEINVKYNAELAALEGTTTTTSNTVQTPSGVETQKAEIERRRQEELNTLNRTTQTSKTQSLEPQGERVYYRIPEEDGSFNLDRKLLQEDSDSLNYSYYFVDSNNNVYLTNERFIARAIDSIDDYLNPIWDIENIAERINATGVEIIEPAKIDSNGRLIKKGKIRFTKSGKITYNFNQTSESETSYDKVKTEINAKYDAEYVDAVKKGEMTKEQAMQALEEVGKKDSSAYAELAALESKTTTPVQQKGSASQSTPTDVAVYRKTAEGATMVSGVIAEKIKKGEFTISENNEEAIKQIESEIEQLDKEIENYNKPPERQAVVKLAEQIRKIEKKISDLIQGNSYTRVFRGDNPTELIKSKPSQEDVNRYKELLKKVSQSSLDTLRLTQNFSVLKDDGLTDAEIGEFRELNSKLGDWSVLDGVSEDGNSVADLLLLLEQYQTQLDQINTKTEYTQKDYLEVKTAPEREASSSETANPMQSPDTVKVQMYNGKYEISHIELTSLATAMGGTLAEKNKDGSTKEVESETTKEKGRVFILTVGDKSVEITIGDHARLVINKKALDEILPNTPLKIVDYGSKKFYDLYEKVDGNFIPLRGDFKYGERELDIEALNQLQKTDKVSLEVDINDPYNKNLLIKYKRAKSEKKKKELLKEIKESLHIYVVVGGRIVGSLRAITGANLSNNAQTQKLLEMRELAMNYIESGGVIPVEIPVKQSFIGSPNYVITDDSNSPTTIPFTAESAKQVVSAGYYEKGKLKLDKNIEAETMFLKTLSGRVPVVVFNYNGRNIAFPVSLVKESIDMSSRLDPIMSMDISQSEQVRLINEVLIEFGISPAEYVLDPTNPLLEGDNLIVLKAIQERMSNIETFADLEMWVNGNYNLVEEAQIAIDITNKPFSANKVILDLSNLAIEDTDAKLIEIFTGKVETAESLRKDLADTYNTLYDAILDFLTTGYRGTGISVTQAEKEIPSQVRSIIDADDGVDTSEAVGYAQEVGKLRGLKKSLLNAKGGIRPFGVKFLEYSGIKLEDIVSKIGQYERLESELTALKIDISDPNVLESVKTEVSKMNCKI